MPDNTTSLPLTLSPAAADLADSLVQTSVATAAHSDLEPGKVGAGLPIGLILSGMSANGAALFAEGILADYLGPPAHALMIAEHAVIARWLSPKLADLGSELLAEFGSKGGAGAGADSVFGYKR